MNENKALKNASEFNNGTSSDSTPSPDEIGTENGNSARKTNGLDENADDLDRSKIEETGRRKVGAPIGNQNRFVHGFYTKQLKKAKTGKQRSVKRMAEATLHAVLADQGDINGLSTTFQFYVQRF